MTSKTDIPVGKLVDMIVSGELSLPEMQRGYVWRADRVRDLLDSLYRGYPSGTILVWETERSVPSRDLAIGQQDYQFKGHKLLLDGQQRLTSLASILRGKPVVVQGQKVPIDILFNLNHQEGPPTEEPPDDGASEQLDSGESDDDDEAEADDESEGALERLRKEAFAKPIRALLGDKYWIRVSDIFSDTKKEQEILKRALPLGWDDPNYARFSQRLQKVRQIKDYIYVMQMLESSMEYEEVAEIFVRVNSRGVKLRSSDLALAQITSRWRDSLRLFESFRDACAQKGFSLDLGLIVRALVVFATGQSRFKKVSTLNQRELESHWERTQRNVRWALDYFANNLGIDHTVLLSSPFLIIALAYYHQHHPTPTVAQSQALRRWLLLASARGHYSRGSTETYLDADLALMSSPGKGPEDLLDVLERQVGRLDFTPHDLAGSGMLSPVLPAVFLALREAGAVDLHTGLGLHLPDNIKARLNNWHYVFSQQSLDGVQADRSEKREIANILFVGTTKGGPKSAGPVDKWLANALTEQGPEAVKTHCLPADMSQLKPELYRQFIEHRRQELANLLNRFINGEHEHRPALDLAALIAKGESATIEFKERALDDQGQVIPPIGKEVTSLLNSDGGVLLVGVADDGRVVGIEDDIARLSKKSVDNYQKSIMDNLLSRIGRIEVTGVRFSLQTLQTKQILVIEVPRGLQSAYCKEGPKAVFYIRMGNQCQALEGKDLEQYVRQRWGHR